MAKRRAAYLALALLTACAPLQLADERVQQPFADLTQADAALEQTVLRFGNAASPSEGTIHMREVRSRALLGNTRPVLVLLNGVFSDGRTWRFNTALLAERYDLLVVDLPGTGRSVGTDPDTQPEDHFTLEWMAARTYRALAAWQEQSQERRPLVLVGHSYSGAVILRMLGRPTLREQFAEERALVRGAVLIASADVGTAGWSTTLVELAKLSETEVALGGALGVLESRVIAGIESGVERPAESALQQEAERMIGALTDPDRRRSSQLMLRRIRPVDAEDRPIAALTRDLSRDHGRVDIPTMLLWGRNDDTLTLDTARKLNAEIPGSRLVVVEEAKHSVHQEQPFATTAAIRAFVDSLEVGQPRAAAPQAP